MTNNSKMPIPGWLIQAVFGILFTCAVAWFSWSTQKVNAQDTRIAVAETRVKSVEENMKEIKESQDRMEAKLDRLIERRP